MEINNKSYIKKAVFVYDLNKNFIGKYDGVMDVQRTFNINHSAVKKYANIAGVYKGYIFSYVRLRN
ncbi:MAG: NUMOD1 domain-containing DNA-binding protein [Rickettsia endosymbiont of Ixodes persulcatus]|nr:NUMOD1 domain-containing DNA-binding protein [Rickettsia endosymbiont of Ixodes persulcatus]